MEYASAIPIKTYVITAYVPPAAGTALASVARLLSHRRTVTRRSWFFIVLPLALSAFALRHALVHSSPLTAAPASDGAVPSRAAASSDASAAAPPSRTPERLSGVGGGSALAQQDQEVEELRVRARASVGFARLPASDQDWVLDQARARVRGPNDPDLTRVVEELSAVRLFAVSEREEPLPPAQPTTPATPLTLEASR